MQLRYRLSTRGSKRARDGSGTGIQRMTPGRKYPPNSCISRSTKVGYRSSSTQRRMIPRLRIGSYEARGLVEQGQRLLPSEVGRVRYEDLKRILLDYYRTDRPASLYHRKTENGGIEECFLGMDKLDTFFKRLPVTEIRVQKIKAYIQWRRKEGDADATIRRQRGHLRLAFNRAFKEEEINRNDVPPFELPKDSDPREGFIEPDTFETLRNAFPEHLRPALTFLYYTGRSEEHTSELQ